VRFEVLPTLLKEAFIRITVDPLPAMRTLNDKLALITGAASGIGRALSIELAAAGTRLLLVDVDGAGLAETVALAERHGVLVDFHVADLSLPEEVHGVAEWAGKAPGGLDILINNAGVAYYGTTHEMTEPQCQRLLAVNLLAPLQLTRELLPALLEQPQAHVLNVCSVAGLVGVTRLALYNTTKFALVGFSDSLRSEYAARGLGITALCPGLVRTRIFETAMTPSERRVPRFPAWLTTSPERVARRAVRAILRNEGLVVVTLPAKFVWWIKRLAPSFLERVQGIRRVSHRPIPPQGAVAAGISMDAQQRAA
jgi:short-subunit dehydrogenase